MERKELPVLPPRRYKPKPPGYAPQMPRHRLHRLTARLMKAKSLKDAARILRETAAKTHGDWTIYLSRLAHGLAKVQARPNQFVTPHPVFVLDGNVKLPFASFSALPEFTCPGAGDCLRWCYSFTAWRYPGPWSRQVMNTLLLKFGRHVITHAFMELARDIVLRLYVDGDFDSPGTIGFWFDLLRSRPDIRAYGYSKSWDLLWEYARHNPLPDNYRLNLSSGGVHKVTARQMMNLSITRGEFIAVTTNYRPPGLRGQWGFERFGDRRYHAAVRQAGEELGLGAVFSCPGKCGECANGEHACGNDKFRGVPILIGTH